MFLKLPIVQGLVKRKDREEKTGFVCWGKWRAGGKGKQVYTLSVLHVLVMQSIIIIGLYSPASLFCFFLLPPTAGTPIFPSALCQIFRGWWVAVLPNAFFGELSGKSHCSLVACKNLALPAPWSGRDEASAHGGEGHFLGDQHSVGAVPANIGLFLAAVK